MSKALEYAGILEDDQHLLLPISRSELAYELRRLAAIETQQGQTVRISNCLWARNGNQPCGGTQPTHQHISH